MLGSKKMPGLPRTLKIDISPLCNLHCITCIHAFPSGYPALEDQEFNSKQKMSLSQFQAIIDSVKSQTLLLSLHYLGDPLMHPDLDEMCQIAGNAGLNVHYSTNFSYELSDERIRSILTSGVTQISICVDGITQDIYETTRIGGNLDLVLNNLKRLCEMKRKEGFNVPNIEVQYIKFQHNSDQFPEAKKKCKALGADQVTGLLGNKLNYVAYSFEKYKIVKPKNKKLLPLCYWPFFSMLIKYNGDVIPCCWHRQGDQYSKSGDPMVLGNVFQTSVSEIWNSEYYRQLRGLAKNPGLFDKETSPEKIFCYGCPMLFETRFE